jgi:dipeptidyl aminopeptidase/acylaminoacyl peptidase
MVTLTVSGARDIVPIATDNRAARPQSWSGGGNLFAYTATGAGTRTDIWILPIGGAAEPTPFLATEFNETLPAISPDGRWIAYVSDETGDREVFIRSYPDDGTAMQVSVGGGTSPVWSRDGRELYYIQKTAMMAVPFATEPRVGLGTTVTLFDGGFDTERARDFDVGPDGRFIATRRIGGGSGLQEVRLLINWQQEVARMGGAAH